MPGRVQTASGMALAVAVLARCGGAVIVPGGPSDGGASNSGPDSARVSPDGPGGEGARGGDGSAGVGIVSKLTFVSDSSWPWFPGGLAGPDGGSLGTAALVCVTSSVPADCPSGAVVYQMGANSGWAADLSAYPGAFWIWRGDVTPSALGDLQFAV